MLFGEMRQPTQENAVGHEIHRAQLHVGLEEEALAVQRNFEELCKGAVFLIGMNSPPTRTTRSAGINIGMPRV